ncbi:MAG TPA: hypothetical protein VMS95_01815 [Candidatus Krumholzibacteriaceae bacterium]|jgi:uncharacterized membrane protein YozB (DUF420 family)|nr:hypothetical protein [Candidatus Krumholzibacteriaceae bacterium]
MGLFNPYAFFLSDVNLLLQMVIFAVLLAGFLLAKFKRSFMKHGITMLVALVLHTVLIFGIMVPSLLSLEEAGLLANLSGRLALFTVPHAILGSIVEIFAIYLVGTFLFNRVNVKSCFKNKRQMKVTIILWFLEIILGVYIYILLYVPI